MPLIALFHQTRELATLIGIASGEMRATAESWNTNLLIDPLIEPAPATRQPAEACADLTVREPSSPKGFSERAAATLVELHHRLACIRPTAG